MQIVFSRPHSWSEVNPIQDLEKRSCDPVLVTARFPPLTASVPPLTARFPPLAVRSQYIQQLEQPLLIAINMAPMHGSHGQSPNDMSACLHELMQILCQVWPGASFCTPCSARSCAEEDRNRQSRRHHTTQSCWVNSRITLFADPPQSPNSKVGELSDPATKRVKLEKVCSAQTCVSSKRAWRGSSYCSISRGSPVKKSFMSLDGRKRAF